MGSIPPRNEGPRCVPSGNRLSQVAPKPLKSHVQLSLDPSLARPTCPACGCPRQRLAFTDRNRREGLEIRTSFVRCLGCRTLYLRDIPSGEQLADAYRDGLVDAVGEVEEVSDLARLSGRRLWLRRLSRLLRGRPHSWPEEAGDGRRILDFGCGTGIKLLEFHHRGWQVAGVDLNRQAIARARALQPWGQWFAGRLEAAPNWEPFDVIRTDNVIEHLPDPGNILRTLKARLRVGGRLLLYVPHGESLSVRLFQGRSQACWIPFHLQLFSRRGLEILLHRVGFGSVRITQYTPLSWWEMTARQAIAKPGYLSRPPSRVELIAIRAAQTLAPVWVLSAKLGLGEELVAEAMS